MKQTIKAIIFPIIALFLFFCGSNWFTILVPVTMAEKMTSITWIGMIGTGFYVAYVLSAVYIKNFITSVGYLRAYGVFASFIVIITLAHGFYYHPFLWVFLGFFRGFFVAASWIVLKSWCLEAGGQANRGLTMGIFMSAFNIAQLCGQYLFRHSGTATADRLPFCLIATVIAFSTIILLGASKSIPPKIEPHAMINLRTLYKMAKFAMIGCFLSGMGLGAIYGVFPACVFNLGFTTAQVSQKMMLIILGGVFFQFPIGKFSDKFDRKSIIIIVSIVGLIASVLLSTSPQIVLFSVLVFVLGGCFFSLYSLSISLGCQLMEGNDIIETTTGLLVVYGSGAAIGPFLASFVIKILGSISIFAFFAIVLLSLALLMFSGRYTLHPKTT